MISARTAMATPTRRVPDRAGSMRARGSETGARRRTKPPIRAIPTPIAAEKYLRVNLSVIGNAKIARSKAPILSNPIALTSSAIPANAKGNHTTQAASVNDEYRILRVFSCILST